jgi:hypothetical protein
MTHLLSTVFKGVVMLSQGSIHFRPYVKRGGYRAMSVCSKYQLLLQTDYVRLRDKYDHLYIYSHILFCIAHRESSQPCV